MRSEVGEASRLPRADLEQAAMSYLAGLVAADYSYRTLRAASSDLGQFVGFLGAQGVKRVGDVGRADLMAFVSVLSDPLLKRPLARSTIARKLSVIRSFFAFCEDEGLVDSSPALGVSSPRLPRRLPQVLTPVQVDELLAAMEGNTPLELRDRALFELIYSSGLRCQEAIDLRLGDVSFDFSEVRAKGKGRKVRVVPVGGPALEHA